MDTQALKNKILQLAIQGKLVTQNENDEPASVLLERIKKEKEQLISNKIIKKEKPLPEITNQEKLFDLPENWEWCRLNDVCRLITDGTHSTPKYTEKGVPFISVKDLTRGFIDFSDTKFISLEEHKILKKRCNPELEDILLTKIGTTGIAKVIDTTKEFSIFVSVALLKLFNKEIYSKYIELLINSPFVKMQSEKNTQGVGNKNLVIRCIKSFIIPIPPIEEQKRIVAKVDSLFKLIDELDSNKQDLLQNISDARNKVLQLAIQGKLVPQNENGEPASVLLKKMKEEKEQLIKDKIIRKEKAFPDITDDEKTFNIPNGWEWCRLCDIGIYKKGPFGSTITKSMFVPKSENTIKVYEQKNAIQKNWKLGDYYVTKEYFEEKLKGFEVFEGDIIVSCAGTIGETYIMPREIERGVINQALMRIKLFNGVDIDYFLMYFDFILKETSKESSKGSAIKNIPPFDIFKKMLLPLPPLEEQKRILAKVNIIMNYLDRLEKEIR
ncbi:restriction endonuclease subunit S [Clostridium perfringens]